MNEKILRLALDAGVLNYVDNETPRRYFISAHAEVEDVEKFAELIVRECINIAYEYDKPKLSGPGLAIASNIESHFDIYIEEDGRFVK